MIHDELLFAEPRVYGLVVLAQLVVTQLVVLAKLFVTRLVLRSEPNLTVSASPMINRTWSLIGLMLKISSLARHD